jgi:alkylation response protein AidB-like acyl-CoA dehydrogenase
MSLFGEAHEAFRARLRSHVEERLAPSADAWEAAATLPLSVFTDLGREGFLDASPECGRDFGYSVVLAEELPRSRMMGLALSVLAQATFFTPLLARLGTPEQKELFLAPSLRGEKIGALAVTEPTGGSDIVRAVRCAAEETGDGWLLRGEKKFITNGPIADFLLVLARTRPEPSAHSLSLFLVPADTPGFRVKESLRKLGMHTSPTGWLEFDGCPLPRSALLGKRNVGYFYVTQNLSQERLLGAASAVAAAQLVLESTIERLRARDAYGTTLSRLQAVRHRVSDVAADLEMARHFVHSVALGFRDGRQMGREICMIKFKVIELVQRAVEQCLQLNGGEGFLADNWIGRVYRDVRVLSLGGGVSELMKDLVAGYLRL